MRRLVKVVLRRGSKELVRRRKTMKDIGLGTKRTQKTGFSFLLGRAKRNVDYGARRL